MRRMFFSLPVAQPPGSQSPERFHRAIRHFEQGMDRVRPVSAVLNEVKDVAKRFDGDDERTMGVNSVWIGHNRASTSVINLLPFLRRNHKVRP